MTLTFDQVTPKNNKGHIFKEANHPVKFENGRTDRPMERYLCDMFACVTKQLFLCGIQKKQECQTDTKYARRICGKFNGNDNILGAGFSNSLSA